MNASKTAIAVLSAVLVGSGLLAPPPVRADVVVRLEATAERVPVHLEPDPRSPVVETLPRGAVVKLASAQRFRTNWYYVLFVSSRSGRTLAGYVLDSTVRKLNSTIRVLDLTPAGAEIADPKEFELSLPRLPEIQWGQSESGILRVEGRPLDRDRSGDMEFLRYHRELLGKRCLLTYVLIDRKLSAVRVHLLERYVNKDRYVADYNAIRDLLSAKIGEPMYNNVVWKDGAYAQKGDKLGEAITSGTLSLSAGWAFRGSAVRLSLTSENSEVLFAAEISDLKTKDPASF